MGACCSCGADEPAFASGAAAAAAGAPASSTALGRPLVAPTTAALADDRTAHREAVLQSVRLAKEKPTRAYAKPRWRAAKEGLSISSRQELERLREAFWDTAPAYGGAPEAWAALKVACEAPDIETTRVILEAAGLVVVRPDLTVVYDERGARYELPKYVLSDPEDVEGLIA